MTIILWAMNTFNFSYLVLWPCYNAFRLSQCFKQQDRKLEFMPEYTYDTAFWRILGMAGRQHPSDASFTIQFIRCRLWYNDTSFYEWKMTENGEMLRHNPGDKKTLFSRERVLHRTLATGGPLKHNINRTHSMSGVVGWAIKRNVAEEFILSKLGGFSAPYDVAHDVA
jgi:hypothetical protein